MVKKISVIIATKNEELNILNCITSIKNQSYKNYEIIVIDNASEDKTAEIVMKAGIKYINLINVSSANPYNCRGAQINLGVSATNGDYIFIPDADMTIEQGFFEEAIGLLEHYDALYSPEEIIGNSHFVSIRNFERSFYLGTCLDVPRIFSKKIFDAVGGFDEENIRFGFDDWDFCKKIKTNRCNIHQMKSKIYHDERRMNVISYLSKKKSYIQDYKPYVQKWGKDDMDIKRQFGLKYRFFTVFLEDKKWRKVINNPVKSLGMYGLRFFVGLFYVIKKNE
jgi:glycosyltransferase involved in cell wall biosynthesis